MSAPQTFDNLDKLARHLREGLDKKYILLFAFNGTGKTRLSMAFKDLGKETDEGNEATTHDLTIIQS